MRLTIHGSKNDTQTIMKSTDSINPFINTPHNTTTTSWSGSFPITCAVHSRSPDKSTSSCLGLTWKWKVRKLNYLCGHQWQLPVTLFACVCSVQCMYMCWWIDNWIWSYFVHHRPIFIPSQAHPQSASSVYHRICCIVIWSQRCWKNDERMKKIESKITKKRTKRTDWRARVCKINVKRRQLRL